MWKVCSFGLIVLMIGTSLVCSHGEDIASDKIKVFVSILPQVYFIERIGGSHVHVDVLVGPGESPHTFEPTPKQMARLGETQIYFRIGIPFENHLLGKISTIYKDIKVVETHKGIKRRTMEEHHDNKRSHHENEHRSEAGEPDPHIWLNPILAKILANTICEELGRIDPAHAPQYSANLKALHADLDSMHAKIARTLAPFRGRAFFVYHPAFGYFGDAYGLEQVAIATGGKEPGPRHLASLIERVQAESVKVIFVQPQFSKRIAQKIEETIGGVVVPTDPLAKDYLNNLESMTEKIARALKPVEK